MRKLVLYLPILFCTFFLCTTKVYASDSTSSWLEGAPLLYPVASHDSFGGTQRISVVSGSARTGQSRFEVISAESFSSDGSLGDWVVVSEVPEALIWHSVAEAGQYVYILGGREENSGSALGDVKTVYKGELDGAEIVESWSAVSSLPAGRSLGAAVVANGRVYYLGGINGSSKFKDIYYADINPDGTLGSWATSSVSLPTELYAFSAIEDNGYIYVIGGANAVSVHQSKVYRAHVNFDGSLSSWQEMSSLPRPLSRSAVIKVDKQIYAIGGEHGLTMLDTVYYADINPDGTLSPWQESANKLPEPVSAASVAQAGNYLYLTGGWNGNYLNTVYFTQVGDDTSLSIPLLKQTDPRWGLDEYDSASSWSSEETFARWGCAVTSAAMVFNYHGLHEMEGGSDLNPGTLNEWLKTQPDGYVRNGLTNWLALSRLSHQISASNGVSFDALEFDRITSNNHDWVRENIDNSLPLILGVPNHFVAAKGYSDSTILINDPFYDRSDLTSYANTFQTASRYTPSNTNLSYIMLVVDPEMDITILDSENNPVGIEFIEEPILDPNTPAATSTAETLKTIYVPKPQTENYTVQVTSVGGHDYILDAYLYDAVGNVKQDSFEKQIEDGEAHTYLLQFDQDSSDQSQIEFVEEVTYESFLNLLKRLYDEGEIKNRGIYTNLVKRTEMARDQRIIKVKRTLLENMQFAAKQYVKSRQISLPASNEIVRQLDILIEGI